MRPQKRKQRMNYVIVKENGVFVAKCADLDLSCPGATEQEAREALEEALSFYFEDMPGPADG